MKHLRDDCMSHHLILAGSGVQCGNCLALDAKNTEDYERGIKNGHIDRLLGIKLEVAYNHDNIYCEGYIIGWNTK